MLWQLVTAHGGGRVVSASGSKTRDSSSTPASAVIYDAYNTIIKKQNERVEKNESPSFSLTNLNVVKFHHAGSEQLFGCSRNKFYV